MNELSQEYVEFMQAVSCLSDAQTQLLAELLELVHSRPDAGEIVISGAQRGFGLEEIVRELRRPRAIGGQR